MNYKQISALEISTTHFRPRWCCRLCKICAQKSLLANMITTQSYVEVLDSLNNVGWGVSELTRMRVL